MPRGAVGDWSDADATVKPNRRPTVERSMLHEQQLALPSQTRAQASNDIRKRFDDACAATWRVARDVLHRGKRPTQ